MPSPKRQIEFDARRDLVAQAPATPDAPPAGELVSRGKPIVYIQSPARLLHEQLSSHFQPGVPTDDTRWPGSVRVAVIVGTSLALWASIGLGVVLSF